MAMGSSGGQQSPIVPLDAPLRTTPIHPLLPDIRVPGQNPSEPSRDSHDDNTVLKTYHYNPTTCLPLQIHHRPSSQPDSGDSEEPDDVSAELGNLRKTHPTRASALQAQTQAAHDAAQRISELTRRREEVQRAMDKKVKERNTEMKVLEKYQEVKVRASDILPS